MLLSLYLSFTDYDVLTPLAEANWVGLDNYRQMFTADPSYWHAVRVTLTFALVAVPLKLAAALGVACCSTGPCAASALFRGLFYLPSLLGGSVALAIVWAACSTATAPSTRSWRCSASRARPGSTTRAGPWRP
jgi:multiple sugar transport system permease protein